MSLLCFLMPLFSRSKGGFDYGEEETKNDGGESMLQHFVSLESNDLSKDDANEAAYKKLKQLFAPFVLRRRKVDALKQLLPPKVSSLYCMIIFFCVHKLIVIHVLVLFSCETYVTDAQTRARSFR